MANLNFETEKHKFSQELDEILEEYFSESSYPMKLKEKTKEMILYFMQDHVYASLSFLVPKLAKFIKPDLSDEEIHMAKSLGWIFHMFQAIYCATDDFVDEGDKRYGKATWSKLQNHSKSIMVYDVSMMRAVTFFSLQKKFSHSPSIYLQVLHLFHDCDNKATKGYRLDSHLLIENLRNGTTSLESFNMETYEVMSSLKFGAVWFYLPMTLALVVTGFKMEDNLELYKKVEQISENFGTLIQVFDDYYDNFCTTPGYDSEDTDIRRGQFTWLLLTAKELCTSKDEVEDLFSHYGIDNDESVNYMKSLYEKIGIHKLVKEYRVKACEKIQEINRTFEKYKGIQEMINWVLKWALKEHKG